jgi:hypothetical protein
MEKKRYETPTYQYPGPRWDTPAEYHASSVHQREKGLRMNNLHDLANYQMAAHNPQSTLFRVTAGHFPAADNLRRFLDTDAQTVMSLTNGYENAMIRALFKEATEDLVREGYNPNRKVYLKRNIKAYERKYARENDTNFIADPKPQKRLRADRKYDISKDKKGKLSFRPRGG